jgi:hypothetical protein
LRTSEISSLRGEKVLGDESAAKPSLGWLRSRRSYLALILIVISVASLVIFFALSYNSAHGTIVQLISASRMFKQPSPSTPFETLTFVIDVHVWSWGATIETQVANPTFSLAVDNYSLPIPGYESSKGFQPGSYAPYTLTFATADKPTIQAEIQVGSSNVKISMDAFVTAGLYSEHRVVSDSRTIGW